MKDVATKDVVLTHDMVATGGGRWRCVDCGRAGTIHFINLVACPLAPKRER